MRLASLELDVPDGASGTEQMPSIPGVSNDWRFKTISIHDFRVACSKWETDLAKNVEKRYFSLALRNIKSKLDLATVALRTSLLVAHRREVTQGMVDDSLTMAKLKIRLCRLAEATVLLRAILKNPEVVMVDRFRGLVLQGM